MHQYSIRYLFLGTLVVACLMAFVAQEPIGVGLATLFCVGSWLGMLWLCQLTINNLVDTVLSSIRQKQFRHLTSRYRWAYLDGLILLWMFFTIVISNFVLENSVANARYLIWLGWSLWLSCFVLMTIRIFWHRRIRMDKSNAHESDSNQTSSSIR